MENILGNRVLLRKFIVSDITEQYISWLNDSDLMRFSNQKYSKHSAKSCSSYMEGFRNTPNMFLAIERLEDEQVIGTITAYVSQFHGTADLGIMVGHAEARGLGFGLEAWNLLVDHLIKEGAHRKITAGTLRTNLPMRRIAERSGMHVEAVRTAQELVDGAETDVLLYAKFS